jgi:hypothetical protein
MAQVTADLLTAGSGIEPEIGQDAEIAEARPRAELDVLRAATRNAYQSTGHS